MIQVFLENGYNIQTQISDFGTMSPSMIKYCEPLDIWFVKKKRKGIKIRIVARLNKILNDIKKGIQKELSDFQNLLGKIKERVHQYIPNLKTPICKFIDGGELSEIEKIAYSNYSTLHSQGSIKKQLGHCQRLTIHQNCLITSQSCSFRFCIL